MGNEEAYKKAAIRLDKANKNLGEFIENTGRTRRRDREQVHGFSRSAAQKVANANKMVEIQKKNDILIEEIKHAANLPKPAVVHLIPKGIDISKLAFDDEHINAKREHMVSREQAEQWVREANISVSVWSGRYERYYGPKGAVYELKYITKYDRANKRYKQIDLIGIPHIIDGKRTLPHSHIGYNHDEHGTRIPSTRDRKLIDKVYKIWYYKQSK